MAKDTRWEPLSPSDKKWIADRIFQLLRESSSDERYGAWVDALIHDLLWFWTADAVHPEGIIKRDAIKHDPRHIHHTTAALRSWEHGWDREEDKLQHEHAGERQEILIVLRREGKTVEDVVAILETLNVAVLVTRGEHRELGRGQWDPDWRKRRWQGRYEAKDITPHPPLRAKSP